VVDGPVTGHRAHRPPEVAEHARPGARHHRDAVVTTEPEGHEGDGRHGGTLPTRGELAAEARRILEAAWRADRAGGFCVPNPTTYPWQWLWDSCFHSVVWAHLGDERALEELRSALVAQDDDGFVPHLRYGDGPRPHQALWGRAAASTITQPPMYGHAAAVLTRLGLPPDGRVLERATRGLRFLLEQRHRTAGGLVELCHPWESGCDDSPRWDDVVPGGRTPRAWFDLKGSLVGSIERAPGGAPLHNPVFAVGSAGFSALVAWNALELAEVTHDDALARSAVELAEAVDARWDADLVTWVDDGPTAAGSGRVRTLDALLPLLVCRRPEAVASLTDAAAFGAACGPRGVHVAEPTHEPTTYWRGPAWPQLTYLLWVATRSAYARTAADSLSRSMVAGAWVSGFAEYWVADTGRALGAVPQTWSALTVVVADPPA
jgi:glucosylglycerate hydrolase